MANKQPTVKQLQSAASRLLKGIDNSTAAIKSHQTRIGEMVPELRQTLTALSNTTPKPVVKAVARVEKAAVKTAKKVPVKKEKTAKKDRPKPVKKAEATGERPALHNAVGIVLAETGPLSKADLHRELQTRYGFNSKPSLYSVLKSRSNEFVTGSGGLVSLASHSKDVVVSSYTAKDEVNEFVNKVASDQSVAQAL